ncbi:hypothetical protein GX51_00228 [Blastomyces parvus]|uniref:Uncharacterized protein n=1 Tax=Blastomyces parvus TaxID=2060905 RepID=A0A2B7XMT3_9EURO|nr:hypothetical protein GX51_00228 [Blastomyces parvus]
MAERNPVASKSLSERMPKWQYVSSGNQILDLRPESNYFRQRAFGTFCRKFDIGVFRPAPI